MIKIESKRKSIDDYLLFSSLQYYFVPFLYALQFYFVQKYDNPYIFVFIAYSFIPILDQLVKIDIRNPTKEEMKLLDSDFKFKLPLYVCLFCDWFYTYWYLNYICTHELSFFKLFGFCFVAGNFATSNINISHELMHKNNKLDKFFGMLTLSRNLYMHFYIEHIHGHHKNVATPNDPATSKFNQSIVGFLPNTIIGSFKSAWGIEVERLKEQEKVKSPWTFKNRMLWFFLNNMIVPLIVLKIFGWFGMAAFIFSAIFSVVYLEGINYIEHYGLQRKQISPGVYEKVDIHHSWNAPHRMSNYLLFKLQRHSDHHENAYKTYQTLCSYSESPHLPQGYTVCIMMCFVPWVWFSVMNEITECYRTSKSVPEEAMARAQRKISIFIFCVTIVTFGLMIIGFK